MDNATIARLWTACVAAGAVLGAAVAALREPPVRGNTP